MIPADPGADAARIAAVIVGIAHERSRSQRLSCAKPLLRNYELNVASIATAYSFNSVKQLTRMFAEFERRGFTFAQGGSWMGRIHFAFFETEDATTTCFETYFFPDDWIYPEPEALFPAPG